MSEDPWWKALPRPSWGRFQKIEQSQGWFEVYQVQPGLYALYEPGQGEEVISYLIVGSKKAILFDTGLGIGDMKKLASEITPLELIVINSHSHFDHVGGNYQFQEIYGMDTSFTKENSKGKTVEEMKEVVTEEAIWKPTPAGFSAKDFVGKPFAITKTLHNGDRFDIGGRKLEVILTPGHTPDSLCLLDRENRLLFTGDTFYPGPLYAFLPGSDVNQYLQSAALLDGLKKDIDYLLPAHNETLQPPAYLSRMHAAFLSLQAGKGSFTEKDGTREYKFEGFSIIVKAP